MLSDGEGKPRLAGTGSEVEFSLSHSGQRVAVAVAAGIAVGVDVEWVGAERDLGALIERVLSPAERSHLAGLAGAARQEAFYRYWVRKEAAVKATGQGLSAPLRAITVSAPSEPAELVSWDGDDPPASGAIGLRDLDPGRDHVGCLATLGGHATASEERDGRALLDLFLRSGA